MKNRNLWIAIVLLLAANLARGVYAQENIRELLKDCENMEVIEKNIVRKDFPMIKKVYRSSTIIKLEYSPELEQQIEEAFHQDREKTLHVVEQKKDGKTYMHYRFDGSNYSYSKSNDIINIIECNEANSRVVVYSFFVNVVPDNFSFPLIGFVNTVIGSHQGLQAGFVNTNLIDFYGAQIGFVNSTFNDNSGLQAGFINTTINELKGAQVGFVNTAGFEIQKGSQIGFVNLMRKETNGAQIGFVNITGKNTQGSQLGFVNMTRGTVHGSQIGFVNFADTITGAPIGFLSIVKKGGYHAFEVSTNEWYPVNLSFKIGIPKLYSIIQGSYNDRFDKRFALGYGFGSLLPLSKRFYFNPEITSIQPVSKGNQMQIQSFVGNFRFKISPNLQIAAGPSLMHAYFYDGYSSYKPVYSFINYSINDKNRFLVGARAELSVNF
jgi:hypothetical protein